MATLNLSNFILIAFNLILQISISAICNDPPSSNMYSCVKLSGFDTDLDGNMFNGVWIPYSYTNCHGGVYIYQLSDGSLPNLYLCNGAGSQWTITDKICDSSDIHRKSYCWRARHDITWCSDDFYIKQSAGYESSSGQVQALSATNVECATAIATTTTAIPTTSQPVTADPTTSKPTTDAPITGTPTTSSPITSAPTTTSPITSEPTSKPTTSEPTILPDFRYLGCYKDQSSRALRYGPQEYGYNPESCLTACINYKYFALQHNGWCSCENDYNHATKYGEATNCPNSQLGGSWANDLFQNNYVESLSPTTSTPTTSVPTTTIPSTFAPITAAPIPFKPTTTSPITLAPATGLSTIATPTTYALITAIPTTFAPVTAAPVTSTSITLAPTTVGPSTASPTTSTQTTGLCISLGCVCRLYMYH